MMQTEAAMPSAIIIPFPKQKRLAPLPKATGSLSSPAPRAVIRPLPPATTPVTDDRSAAPLAGAAKPISPHLRTTGSQTTGLSTSEAYKPRLTNQPAAPLSGVMAELDHALTQQGAAVARWRKAINDLRVAMDGLEGSLKQYRDSLAPSNNGATG